jgi:hypothetical protein
MIKFEISYHDSTGRGHAHPVWKNLVEDICRTIRDPDGVRSTIFGELQKYNATMTGNSIEFETEEDLMLFILRWA